MFRERQTSVSLVVSALASVLVCGTASGQQGCRARVEISGGKAERSSQVTVEVSADAVCAVVGYRLRAEAAQSREVLLEDAEARFATTRGAPVAQVVALPGSAGGGTVRWAVGSVTCKPCGQAESRSELESVFGARLPEDATGENLFQQQCNHIRGLDEEARRVFYQMLSANGLPDPCAPDADPPAQ